MRNLKIDKIFWGALIILVAEGIYMYKLREENKTMKKEFALFQVEAQYREKVQITLEQCLWNMCAPYSLAEHSFYEYIDKEISSPNQLLPVEKLVINCCGASADSLIKQNMAEVLNTCNGMEQLQIITGKENTSFIDYFLSNNPSWKLWLPKQPIPFLNVPSVFWLDQDRNIRCYLVIDQITSPLLIKYIRYIENHYLKNHLIITNL